MRTDHHAISMEVYVQAREILALFESLLNGAQLRHLLLLKEISNIRRSRMADFPNVGVRKSRPSDVTFSANKSY